MEYPLQNFKYPCIPEIDKTNPYLRPDMPQEMFDKIWENLRQAAVKQLSQLDPSHAELYQEILKEGDNLFDPRFKQQMIHYLAGCFDIQSPLFQQMTRNLTGKIMTYSRFEIERRMYRKELDEVKLKNNIFIASLPRSGSTFLHNLIVNDPRATGIKLYEHLTPGCKTMNAESRKVMANMMLGQVQKETGSELNVVHSMDNIMNYEEELFFMEMLGQCFIISSAVPRLEQYRVQMFEQDYHYVYEALIDEFKMHLMEFPLKGDDGFLVTKAVSHFASMAPLLDVIGREEYNAHIIWIHREPVDQIKSFLPLLMAAKGRFEHDLGGDDIEWLNKYVIKMNEVILRNSIAARDAWIAQDPSRAKRIYDVGFTDAVKDPKGTIKKIYDYFGIEMTEEIEKQLDITLNEKDPQAKHGRKKHDVSMFYFNDDDIRKQYEFYYERFGQYMPNYWGKK